MSFNYMAVRLVRQDDFPPRVFERKLVTELVSSESQVLVCLEHIHQLSSLIGRRRLNGRQENCTNCP